VLAATNEPMRLRDIHSALEEMLVRPISMKSLKTCMRRGVCGDSAWLIRVSRGLYSLRDPGLIGTKL
jgi:hypothetical protein